MIESWIQFVIVITLQLVLFFTYAYFTKRLSRAFALLCKGAFIGVTFGLAFDLLVGLRLEQYTYVLGFTPTFLLLNGLFSWGFFLAHTFLLDKLSAPLLYVHLLAIAIYYEILNYHFPVWQWTFASSELATYLFVVGIGYPGLATIFMGLLVMLYRHKFLVFKL